MYSKNNFQRLICTILTLVMLIALSCPLFVFADDEPDEPATTVVDVVKTIVDDDFEDAYSIENTTNGYTGSLGAQNWTQGGGNLISFNTLTAPFADGNYRGKYISARMPSGGGNANLTRTFDTVDIAANSAGKSDYKLVVEGAFTITRPEGTDAKAFEFLIRNTSNNYISGFRQYSTANTTGKLDVLTGGSGSSRDYGKTIYSIPNLLAFGREMHDFKIEMIINEGGAAVNKSRYYLDGQLLEDVSAATTTDWNIINSGVLNANKFIIILPNISAYNTFIDDFKISEIYKSTEENEAIANAKAELFTELEAAPAKLSSLESNAGSEINELLPKYVTEYENYVTKAQAVYDSETSSILNIEEAARCLQKDYFNLVNTINIPQSGLLIEQDFEDAIESWTGWTEFSKADGNLAYDTGSSVAQINKKGSYFDFVGNGAIFTDLATEIIEEQSVPVTVIGKEGTDSALTIEFDIRREGTGTADIWLKSAANTANDAAITKTAFNATSLTGSGDKSASTPAASEWHRVRYVYPLVSYNPANNTFVARSKFDIYIDGKLLYGQSKQSTGSLNKVNTLDRLYVNALGSGAVVQMDNFKVYKQNLTNMMPLLNKGALIYSIRTADAIFADAAAGFGEFEYKQADKDALGVAITTAKSVYDTEDNQYVVDAAAVTLTEAIAAFKPNGKELTVTAPVYTTRIDEIETPVSTLTDCAGEFIIKRAYTANSNLEAPIDANFVAVLYSYTEDITDAKVEAIDIDIAEDIASSATADFVTSFDLSGYEIEEKAKLFIKYYLWDDFDSMTAYIDSESAFIPVAP